MNTVTLCKLAKKALTAPDYYFDSWGLKSGVLGLQLSVETTLETLEIQGCLDWADRGTPEKWTAGYWLDIREKKEAISSTDGEITRSQGDSPYRALSMA